MKRQIRLIATYLSFSLLIAGCNATTENTPEDSSDDTSITEQETRQTTTSDTEISEEDPTDETEQAEEAEPAENLYQAYYDFIQNPSEYEWDGRYYEMCVYDEMDFGWDSFQLIDLDGDGSDELIVTNRSEDRPDAGMNYYLVVDRYEGEIVITELADGVASAGGYRGTKYYIPGRGIIYDISANAPYGAPGFSAYGFSNGGYEYSIGGYMEPASDLEYPDNWDNGTWYWNGEEVTEEEYFEFEAEYTENYSGIALEDIEYMDEASMLNILETEGV